MSEQLGGEPAPHEVQPARRFRWWVPLFVSFLVVVCAAIAGGAFYGVRAARAQCTFASTAFQSPAGWKRVTKNTFARGGVEGTIQRIAVPRTDDETRLQRFYDQVLAREQEAVRSNSSTTSTMAKPLQGNIGAFQRFSYEDGAGVRFTRVDHIMHPSSGGCGWHFRASFASSNESPGEQDASFMPDQFDFDA